MEPITSGSTVERIVRTSLVTIMVIGYAGWSFRDGYVGYPLKNLKRAVEGLTPPLEASGELILPTVNEELADTVKEHELLKDVVARIGEPGWRGTREEYYTDRYGTERQRTVPEARYFGPAGQLILTLDDSQWVVGARYVPATFKDAAALRFQVRMGIVLSVVGLLLLLHLFRILIVKATLTDEGIKFTARALVPFEAMTELHAENYARKGWVDLDYEMGDRQGTLRLNDYHIKAFPQVIAEICRRKDWEDPYQEWQERKKNTATPDKPALRDDEPHV
ncbi:MAG: hypothetical protein KAV82_00225 [Phycisphaerae bacterium]|nr:hypothetical protein [Phycisphaerae bacterium]